MRWLAWWCLLLGAVIGVSGAFADAVVPRGTLVMDTIPGARLRLGGELGARIQANLEHWTLRVPSANPGLLNMFARRDRVWPYADMVPWAGEFAGKFLTSAVLSRGMVDDPRLDLLLRSFVAKLAACQDADGYLGPWRAHEHWTGYWDLWGHYHLVLGLLAWYDDTGDQQALDLCLRIADGICDLYATGDRRPIDAGSPEVNFALLHGIAMMYRRVGEPRYLALANRIVEDMARSGDWLNLGASGVPYWQLPRNGTRWESLHAVQGFVEMFRITGESRYRDAAINLWRSLREYDRHPSGAFSTAESAHGSIFDPGSIETCCSVAWLALTVDILRLTGDATVADELELTTLNQAMAAQHPSGSWCTYDTPLNGVRVPSYHHINFQYRIGTPELNCCSVNAPRALGLVRDWAVTRDDKGVYVNYYGPGEISLKQPDGGALTLVQETDYPLGDTVRLRVRYEGARPRFSLGLRIPAWSRETELRINEAIQDPPRPGTYYLLERSWEGETLLTIRFDMHPRHWPGRGPMYEGRAAFFWGPVLLAFDTGRNTLELDALPPVDAADFKPVNIPTQPAAWPGEHPPMGLWSVTAADGQQLLLCDFASAGAEGTAYAAWLPAVNRDPLPAALLYPGAGETARPGPVVFAWIPPDGRTPCTLWIARDPDFKGVVLRRDDLRGGTLNLDVPLDAPGTYYWKIVTPGPSGTPLENVGGARAIVCDPAAEHPFICQGPDGLLLHAPLRGTADCRFARLVRADGNTPAEGRNGEKDTAVRFDGTGMAVYELASFPRADYTFAAWVCPENLDRAGLQQVFSAWRAGLDDPLRVTIEGGRLSARLEAGAVYGTPGEPVQPDTWIHVAAVKRGNRLTLYVDGERRQAVKVPEQVISAARTIAMGGNPLFPGETFQGRVQDVHLWARALEPEEIRQLRNAD